MWIPIIGIILVVFGIQHYSKKQNKAFTTYTTKVGDKPSAIQSRMGLTTGQWLSSVLKINTNIPLGTVDKTGTFLKVFTFKLPPGITDKGAKPGAMGTFA